MNQHFAPATLRCQGLSFCFGGLARIRRNRNASSDAREPRVAREREQDEGDLGGDVVSGRFGPRRHVKTRRFAVCVLHRAGMSTHTPERSHAERMEPLLTIEETAAFLGVSRRQVYALLERGDLPRVRVGSRIRFIPAELRAYLERQAAP